MMGEWRLLCFDQGSTQNRNSTPIYLDLRELSLVHVFVQFGMYHTSLFSGQHILFGVQTMTDSITDYIWIIFNESQCSAVNQYPLITTNKGVLTRSGT
jgi:hypothetical protein